MQRKEFIKTCSMACLGLTAISTLMQACATSNYFAKASFNGSEITLKKSEFIAVENNKETQRKYVLIKSDQLSFPICIYKMDADNYSALLLECTHRSCELKPQGDYLICPCHGSEFTKWGEVQNPPAEENLRTFKVTTDKEHVYIYVG